MSDSVLESPDPRCRQSFMGELAVRAVRLMLAAVVMTVATGEALCVTVHGKFEFIASDGEFFGESPLRGDPITVHFGYDTDAEEHPILPEYKKEFDVDYTHFYDGSYDLDFLELQINATLIDLPDPKLSIVDSAFLFLECDQCLHTREVVDNFVVSSSLDNFNATARGGGSFEFLDVFFGLPDSMDDFLLDTPTLLLRPLTSRKGSTEGTSFALGSVGDFNMDTGLSPLDMDVLSERVAKGISGRRFDLNDDGLVNSMDRTFWVEQLVNTHFGDADLNGTVEFADFLQLSAHFGEETGWAGGDFDGNGVAEFADLLLLSDNFGKTRAQLASVPEPHAGLMLGWMIAGLGLAARHRRPRKQQQD